MNAPVIGTRVVVRGSGLRGVVVAAHQTHVELRLDDGELLDCRPESLRPLADEGRAVRVISIPQAGGGVRYVALDRRTARTVRENPEMIRVVGSLACLDIDANGCATWERPMDCDDTAEGREAIRAFRRGDGS